MYTLTMYSFLHVNHTSIKFVLKKPQRENLTQNTCIAFNPKCLTGYSSTSEIILQDGHCDHNLFYITARARCKGLTISNISSKGQSLNCCPGSSLKPLQFQLIELQRSWPNLSSQFSHYNHIWTQI